MNINQAIDKLRYKWFAKLLCLVVAIFLYIVHQAMIIEHKNFVIPLHLQNNGIVMPVGTVPSVVSLSIRANPEVINSIHTSDFRVFLDMDNITSPGTYELPVKVSLNDNLMTYDPFEVSVNPEKIKISVDKKLVKFVKVRPSLVGELAHGYKVADVDVTPPYVAITGPSTVVDGIDEIFTSRVNISNAETSFTTEAYYQKMVSLISVESEGPYKVTVSLSQDTMSKSFDKVQVNPVNLNDDLELYGEISPVHVKISGYIKNIEDFNLDKRHIQVDLMNLVEPGTYEIPVQFYLPQYLTVDYFTPEKVSVTVVESKKGIFAESEVVIPDLPVKEEN